MAVDAENTTPTVPAALQEKSAGNREVLPLLLQR